MFFNPLSKKLKTAHNSRSVIPVYISSRREWREFKYQIDWNPGISELLCDGRATCGFSNKNSQGLQMLSLSHHSPSRMKKHLDQTRSRVSFPLGFPKNQWNGLWERRENDGEGVALRTERGLFEAECQHRFVHKVDGLHLAGWLVYPYRQGWQFFVSFTFLPFTRFSRLLRWN